MSTKKIVVACGTGGVTSKNIAMKMGHILRLHTEHFPCLSIDILWLMVGSLRNSRHGHGLIVFIGRFCCFFRQILPAAYYLRSC